MIPANLIINADDFGIELSVSKGIAHCVEKGLINSFSVLPFADPLHDELLKSIIAQYPKVKVGSHLSLLGPSLQTSEVNETTALVENPNHYQDFMKLYLTGRYPSGRIYREWKAQILFLAKYLGGPSRLAHLDSHQHIHMLPGIWQVAVALQREFGIPRLRIPYESLLRSLGYKFPFGLALQALAAYRAAGRRLPEQKVRRLLGFFTSTNFTLEANRKALEQVTVHPELDFELMVHPALRPDAMQANSVAANMATVKPSQFQEMEELRLLQDFFCSHLSASK